MSRTPLGNLAIAAMNIAGTTVAGFRSDGYNFATGQHLNPVQRRDSRINTVINAGTLPIGMGGGTAVRAGSQIAGSSATRHAGWAADLGAISESVTRLGQRALRQAGNNPQLSERLFEGYLNGVGSRLGRVGSEFGIEIQPASLANTERVPNFIFLNRGGPNSPLISWPDGTPRLYAFPGSRRLDAGVFNATSTANEHGLRPLVAGFDITLSPTKPNIVPYYQKHFGDIPIYDIRLPR